MAKAPRKTRPPAPRLEPPPTAHLEPTQFKVGESKGRPHNSRNRLQGSFLRELANDFDKYGRGAIMRAREEDPLGYVRVVASLMPKELEFKRPLEDFEDDELLAMIDALRAQVKEATGEDAAALMKEPGTLQ